jgi:hypothetical protein
MPASPMVLMMRNAMESYSVANVERVLESGYEPNQILVAEMKDTALHHAVRHHDAAMCKVLIEAGAKVDAKNRDKHSPLYIAIDMGRPLDVVRTLIDAGANVRWKDQKNQTLLHKAAGRDNDTEIFSAELCQLLLDSGADLFALTAAKRSVLHRAQHLEAWQFFTNAGIDPNFVPAGVGAGYLTPFQHAVITGCHDIVASCVASGTVDVMQKTLRGESLLSLATDPTTLSILRAEHTTQSVAGAVAGAEDAPKDHRRSEPSAL